MNFTPITEEQRKEMLKTIGVPSVDNLFADIDDSIKIILGPTGKTGISINRAFNLNFLTNGASLIEFLEFEEQSAEVLRKSFEQSAAKTFKISGDGSTTTLLFCCQLLNSRYNLLSI